MKSPAAYYQIRVRGHLDQRWAEWFDGFELQYEEQDTVLGGAVPDQAALHGILVKIRDLGLPIIMVVNLSEKI